LCTAWLLLISAADGEDSFKMPPFKTCDHKINRRSHQRAIRHMKLSVEARVAAAVGIAFAALSVGAIAQEQSEGGPKRSNAYSATNSFGVSQPNLLGVESSLSGSQEEQARSNFSPDTD
jgi:hypothetical protein